MVERLEYPFQSRFAVVDGVRLHYIDEGRGPVIWLMHGSGQLLASGYRCFALDLMGFGLSDKPADEQAHTVQRHVASIDGADRTNWG